MSVQQEIMMRLNQLEGRVARLEAGKATVTASKSETVKVESEPEPEATPPVQTGPENPEEPQSDVPATPEDEEKKDEAASGQ